MSEERNVLGEPLQPCSNHPLTGFFRTGSCITGEDDVGRHIICCEMTAEFLAFSKSRGNDLSTPRPEMAFPGLKPGDRWCLSRHAGSRRCKPARRPASPCSPPTKAPCATPTSGPSRPTP